MKKVFTIEDVEGSLNGMLCRDNAVYVSFGFARFMWDSVGDLQHWANFRDSDVKLDGLGYIISKRLTDLGGRK